jgi:hypothetical protein
MKKISRLFLFGALTLVLMIAACAPAEGTAPVADTPIPGDLTASPSPVETETTGTAETATTEPGATLDTTATVDLTTTPAATDTTQTATTQTPGVPVTGADLILLECQFCIEGMANAVLVLPETATFEMVADAAALSTPGPDTGCTTVDTFSGRQVVICRSQENTSLTLDICMNGTDCTQLLVELQSCPVTGTPAATDTPGAGVGTATDTPAATVTDTPAVADTPTPTP